MIGFDALLNMIQHPILISFAVDVINKLPPDTREKLVELAAKKLTEYVSKNS